MRLELLDEDLRPRVGAEDARFVFIDPAAPEKFVLPSQQCFSLESVGVTAIPFRSDRERRCGCPRS